MIGPLAYIGGKRRLAPTLVRMFPDHVTYVEPFCGGAQVFFHKTPSQVEVLNDLDGEIVNFLRVCQRHHPELLRLLRFLVPSRSLFGQFSSQDPSQLTDVERACRFLYLQKNAFAGRRRNRSFHYVVAKPSNFNPARLPQTIARAAKRLARVQLECCPYEQILRRYDRSTTLFYLDPPYWRADLYQFNFADADFEALAERLRQIHGRFLLSINDTPQTRRIFRLFAVQSCSVPYTATRAVTRVDELLVANYELSESMSIDIDGSSSPIPAIDAN